MAESKGKGQAYHDAVFRAYFAEGRNIGRLLNSWYLPIR